MESTDFDKLGYKIRPEEHPNHPSFASYGRSDGRSKRATKQVNRAYKSDLQDLPKLVDRINDARRGEDDEGFYECMNAIVEYFADFEDDEFNLEDLDQEDFFSLFAGFTPRIRTISYHEAMKLTGTRKQNAIEAMKKEAEQMDRKEVWDMVEIPRDAITVLDTQWVFTEKFDSEGNYVKTKARIVVRGDKQVEGQDYDETYSNLPTFGMVRFTLALIYLLKLEPRQLDVGS